MSKLLSDEELLAEIEDLLDDIKGCAEKLYYPFMDDESRLSHIFSAIEEHQLTKEANQ